MPFVNNLLLYYLDNLVNCQFGMYYQNTIIKESVLRYFNWFMILRFGNYCHLFERFHHMYTVIILELVEILYTNEANQTLYHREPLDIIYLLIFP